jgi:hypothetical protein
VWSTGGGGGPQERDARFDSRSIDRAAALQAV